MDGKCHKEEISPKVGDVMDRYGSVYGTYTSPFNGTKGYSFSERALPYIENPNVYHKYEVIRDFRELKEVIETWPDKGLLDEFFMDAKAYGYDMDNFTSFAGEIAPAFDAVGGGIQWKFPMSIEYLEEFGFIKEIK
ncbi:TNT domain-containing protein [Bacillus mycoides]|uniref:TNT domain-containing protein n=1 Tax=Bacillus mycoides TaxID=1405 RepID=UPI003D25ACDC